MNRLVLAPEVSRF